MVTHSQFSTAICIFQGRVPDAFTDRMKHPCAHTVQTVQQTVAHVNVVDRWALYSQRCPPPLLPAQSPSCCLLLQLTKIASCPTPRSLQIIYSDSDSGTGLGMLHTSDGKFSSFQRAGSFGSAPSEEPAPSTPKRPELRIFCSCVFYHNFAKTKGFYVENLCTYSVFITSLIIA